MRRAVGMLLTAIAIAACTGGSDAEPIPLETAPAVTLATTTAAPEPVGSTDPPVTEPNDTTTIVESTTTTIDETAILAEAEAAYFEAWQIRIDALRNPSLSENEKRLREHYSGPNLDATIGDLELTREGGFVSKENEDAPAFATIAESAEFVDDTMKEAVEIVVCEFNSDQLFEVGTAPDGGDVLVRDDPVTFLNVVRMQLDAGVWKLHSGTEFEAVRDKDERCSDLA